jgi:hypothetical protein
VRRGYKSANAHPVCKTYKRHLWYLYPTDWIGTGTAGEGTVTSVLPYQLQDVKRTVSGRADMVRPCPSGTELDQSKGERKGEQVQYWSASKRQESPWIREAIGAGARAVGTGED